VRDILNAEGNKVQMSASTASLPSMLRVEKNAKSDDVDVARKKYAEQHKSQFVQLIEAARKSRATKLHGGALIKSLAEGNSQSSTATVTDRISTVVAPFSSVNSKSVSAATTLCSFVSCESNSPTDFINVLPGNNLPTLHGMSGHVSDSETSSHADDDTGGGGSADLVMSGQSTELLSVDSSLPSVDQHRSVTAEMTTSAAATDEQQSKCDESSSSLPPTQNYSYRMTSVGDENNDNNNDDDDYMRALTPDLLGFLDGIDMTAVALQSDDVMASSLSAKLPRSNVAVTAAKTQQEALVPKVKWGRKSKRYVEQKEMMTESLPTTVAEDVPALDSKRHLRSETRRMSDAPRRSLKRNRQKEEAAVSDSSYSCGGGNDDAVAAAARTKRRCRH
jgi:hypothetical protein